MSIIPISSIVEINGDLKSLRLRTPENEEVIFCYVDYEELEEVLKEGYVIIRSKSLLSDWLENNLGRR